MSRIKQYGHYKRVYSHRRRSDKASLEKPQHFIRWVHSLGQPPKVKPRKKFEYIYKVSGPRFLKTVGKQMDLVIHLFLNVSEPNRIVDYALGKQSHYTVCCEVVDITGPGLANHKKPSVITVKILRVKSACFTFSVPEKYNQEIDPQDNVQLPGEGVTLRILYDPQCTVDEFRGLILSFGSSNNVLRQVVRVTPYLPPKYEPILAKISP